MTSVIADVGVTFSVPMVELELDPSTDCNSGDSMGYAEFRAVTVDAIVVEKYARLCLCNHLLHRAAPKEDEPQNMARKNPKESLFACFLFLVSIILQLLLLSCQEWRSIINIGALYGNQRVVSDETNQNFQTCPGLNPNSANAPPTAPCE